jgi:hypothetical protein
MCHWGSVACDRVRKNISAAGETPPAQRVTTWGNPDIGIARGKLDWKPPCRSGRDWKGTNEYFVHLNG